MAFFLLLLYLLIVFIRPQDFLFSASYAEFPVVLNILLLTIIAFIFSKNKSLYAPQVVLLFLLLGVIGLSSVFNGWFGGIPVFIATFSSAAIIPFILFSSLVNTTTKHKIVMLICISAALLMVHHGINQKSSETGMGWAGVQLSQGTRITYLGTLNDPNDLGMFFVMTLPMAIYFFASVRKKFKIIPLLAAVILLYGIYLTDSRGTLVSVFVLCSLWMWRKYGYIKMAMIAIMIVPFIDFILSKFREIDAQEDSALGRVEAWYEGFQMLKQNPLFGVGMRSFSDNYSLTAHNSYVLVLAELGVVGFTIWLSIIILTFYMLYKIVTYQGSFLKVSKAKKVTTDTHNDENSQLIKEEVMLANSALYSMLGFATTAFFLSRSYTFILYIYAGLSVACYYRALSKMPQLQTVEIKGNMIWLTKISFAVIIFLYLVIKILLQF